MSQRLIQRTLSLSLAAVLTLAMLGSIDQLAQRGDDTSLWSLQRAATQPRA